MTALVVKWTLPALLAGQQTVIRLPWNERTAAQYREGSAIQVYARDPRNGGRELAELRVLHDAAREPLCEVPDTDWGAMGWRWLHEHPEVLRACFGPRITAADFSWDAFEKWRRREGTVMTIRFELVAVAHTEERATAA